MTGTGVVFSISSLKTCQLNSSDRHQCTRVGMRQHCY